MGHGMRLGYLRLTALAVLAGVGVTPTMARDATDWGGFYAGVYGGYALDELPSTTSTEVIITDPQFPLVPVDSTFDGVDAPFGGVRGGWNYQQGGLVMGLEGSLSVGSFNRSRTRSVFGSDEEPVPSTVSLEQNATFESNFISTFEGRIGLALDNWLVYGKAGFAVGLATTKADYHLEYIDGPDPDDSFELPSSGSASGLLIGAAIGIGAEAFVTDELSIGLEYSFVHLPAQVVPLEFAGDDGDSGLGEVGIHTLKAGLNYHF